VAGSSKISLGVKPGVRPLPASACGILLTACSYVAYKFREERVRLSKFTASRSKNSEKGPEKTSSVHGPENDACLSKGTLEEPIDIPGFHLISLF
jgi:hypothetical protein